MSPSKNQILHPNSSPNKLQDTTNHQERGSKSWSNHYQKDFHHNISRVYYSQKYRVLGIFSCYLPRIKRFSARIKSFQRWGLAGDLIGGKVVEVWRRIGRRKAHVESVGVFGVWHERGRKVWLIVLSVGMLCQNAHFVPQPKDRKGFWFQGKIENFLKTIDPYIQCTPHWNHTHHIRLNNL